MVRVKICCISSVAEAELAVRHGASALGLVDALLLDSGRPGGRCGIPDHGVGHC